MKYLRVILIVLLLVCCTLWVASYLKIMWFSSDGLSWLQIGNGTYLHDSIFEVMDEIESRAGGQSEHPTVDQLREAMNMVDVDLGWYDPE